MKAPVLYVSTDKGDEEVELPCTWAICPQCDGNGTSSAHLGAITQDEWADWDDDDKDMYLQGGYDKPCEHCDGSGKVREVDESRMSPEHIKAWRKQQAEDAADRNAAYWERLHETGVMG